MAFQSDDSVSDFREKLLIPATESAEKGFFPPVYPEWLGDPTFSKTHGCRFNYVVGEMAQGIATPHMVVAAVNAGCAGFYGSAGLPLDQIRDGLTYIASNLSPGDQSWGANLIHSPQQPAHESRTVDLFLEMGVRRVSASAYMALSAQIVRYTATGLVRAPDGSIQRRNHVFAKISRSQVAEHFMRPAPNKILRDLVAQGAITEAQAALAAKVPVAADITAEADSGGHTDNRPAAPLYASISRARKRVCAEQGWPTSTIRIGLAGGIATPHGVAAAFQMGAAYVLTGSINQAAVESGLSLPARELLAKAGMADVAMAPAADMFEQGVEVQVLKRGTLFAMRGRKLYTWYRAGHSFETLSKKDQTWLEDILGETYDEAWAETRRYIVQANPKEAEKADQDGNKRLALIARRYLFLGAQWARNGDLSRKADYQIWTGPAQGAFNEWVSGTDLEPLENRTVRQIAWNLMEGAAQISRAGQIRACGYEVSDDAFDFNPQLFA